MLTSRADGDMRAVRSGVMSPPVADGGPVWTFASQVHGADVGIVDEPVGIFPRPVDALVTTATDVPIALLAADCALVALVSDEGPAAVAHAGWRGLVSGVLEASVAAVRELGGVRIHAVVSPMIRAQCYAFSPDDLDAVVVALGAAVRSHTASGQPALDLHAGVTGVLERAGVAVAWDAGECTACQDEWYSWRARRDEARHALALWRRASADRSQR